MSIREIVTSERVFVAMYPLVILAVYRRSKWLFAAILMAVGVNLRVVSPPETDEAWSTRIVLGERVWIEEGLLSSTESLGVVAAGGAVHLWMLRAAAKRQPVRTAVGTVVSVALMLLFFDRMVGLYENRRTRGTGPGAVPDDGARAPTEKTTGQ